MEPLDPVEPFGSKEKHSQHSVSVLFLHACWLINLSGRLFVYVMLAEMRILVCVGMDPVLCADSRFR
jgi:hypothetical protein